MHKIRLETVDRRRETKKLVPLFFVYSLLSVVFIAGCGPKYTYPGDQVPESIERITKKENDLDVTARVVGTTAGALYYVDDLIDEKGQIPKEIHEKMGQIMQAVTRVSLSTDRDIEFCVVIIRDRANLNELEITRSLDDTKRANSDAIGVEESINRTLFGQGKYPAAEEKGGSFALKEVRLEDFLAEQIAQRIRFGFARGSAKEEGAAQPFVLVDGAFNEDGAEKTFRFSVLSLKAEEPNETMVTVLRTVGEVLQGYKFTGYTSIEVLDYLNRQKLVFPKEVLEAYQQKKMSEQEILDKYLSESQTIQEAFKLFGFNLTESADTIAADAPPIAAATP